MSMLVVEGRLTIHLNAKVDLVLGRVWVAVAAELDAGATDGRERRSAFSSDRY